MTAPSENAATLLVSCPDRKGIVAALAQLLYGHGANILDADQHTDTLAGQFFQRIRFDLTEMHTDRVAIEKAIAEVSGRLGMTHKLSYANRPKNVAIFVSRYGHCLHDLLFRHRLGEFDCAIRLIVANHPDMEEVAKQYDVPFHLIPVAPDTKAAAEAAQLRLLAENEIDLVVLARYMQVVSDDFVGRYPNRIINIHHSFLPAFIGQKPYHQAHRRGVKLIGATAHYATAALDEGPIIEQDVARISHKDSVEDLIRKGRDLEKIVLARAFRLHLEDRLLVYGNKSVVFD
ncbi:MAG TPA: formyltetrahydrofolate deformylase [Polyangiaceae bacterium]|jgi:formyltetrahydrofolate deformylase|nr:formyltetrahydrofolate deformylase [Polyangiaceae bacterium]